MPTSTGLRRSIFSVGPGPGLASRSSRSARPSRAWPRCSGPTVDLSGYGPYHVNAVALGSLLYRLRRGAARPRRCCAGTSPPRSRWARRRWSGAATFLHWYMVQQPTMSHAPSACGGGPRRLAVGPGPRERGPPPGYLLLGLVLGLAMCLRWQNGVLLVLPGLDLLAAWPRERGAPGGGTATGAIALAAGALVGAFPQMAAWKVALRRVGAAVPAARGGLRPPRSPVPARDTLFSSRHGLLSWTPVLWAGYLGFVPAPAAARRGLALPLLRAARCS